MVAPLQAKDAIAAQSDADRVHTDFRQLANRKLKGARFICLQNDTTQACRRLVVPAYVVEAVHRPALTSCCTPLHAGAANDSTSPRIPIINRFFIKPPVSFMLLSTSKDKAQAGISPLVRLNIDIREGGLMRLPTCNGSSCRSLPSTSMPNTRISPSPSYLTGLGRRSCILQCRQEGTPRLETPSSMTGQLRSSLQSLAQSYRSCWLPGNIPYCVNVSERHQPLFAAARVGQPT